MTWLSRKKTAPQPPGPGFGREDPSVKMPVVGPSVNRASTSSVVRSRVSVTLGARRAGGAARFAGGRGAAGRSRQSMHWRGVQLGYFCRTAFGSENVVPQSEQVN